VATATTVPVSAQEAATATSLVGLEELVTQVKKLQALISR
jgi:hypothetical protein